VCGDSRFHHTPVTMSMTELDRSARRGPDSVSAGAASVDTLAQDTRSRCLSPWRFSCLAAAIACVPRARSAQLQVPGLERNPEDYSQLRVIQGRPEERLQPLHSVGQGVDVNPKRLGGGALVPSVGGQCFQRR
jgi:hypothetical protein